MSAIKLIEVPSEIGAGTRGAHRGIAALKEVAKNSNDNIFEGLDATIIEVDNSLAQQLTNTENARQIEGIVPVYEKLVNAIRQITDNEFLLVLAGDHSSAGGTISGLKVANTDKRIGVIWVDAHADLHSPFTSPSGNVHGMPLAAVINEDNTEHAVNKPNDKAIEGWNALKNVGGLAPKIAPQDICFIGVRSTEKPEDKLIAKHNIRNISVTELRGKGADSAAIEALNQLKSCDLIYVSFDVDSMDTSISRGTGTPVDNGLYLDETVTLLTRLVSHPKVGAFEMVEINPLLDTEKPMAVPAFKVLKEVLKSVEQK